MSDPIERLAHAGDSQWLANLMDATLEGPAGDGSDVDGAQSLEVHARESMAGMRIGHYKLLQEIGHGGMGVVFMAQQDQPVRRRVAIKIIKPGMDSREVIARFEAERQALAIMEHPNIARIFEAGATESGQPFFVMELVDGIAITDFCDQKRLSLKERLELFIPVCKAVQHAHQKGIIHRDLKPSNVMVTLHDGTPLPKVIDFGIAKAVNQHLTERTLFTEYGQLIGTPEYSSPEQADVSGVDVDTRSDIYSLGALLYQLLTGTTPFDSKQLRGNAYGEIQRFIREVEPPKPSTRLSTLGAGLQTLANHMSLEPNRLSRLLAGDLDWIVMKCLEKDRARRYETASGLAADVQRHLNSEPVEASPPSAIYRGRKFVRKHRIALTIAALLLAATSISTWQAIRATRAQSATLAEKQRTDQQTKIAQAVIDFLNDDVLSMAGTSGQGSGYTPDRDLKVRDALDRAAARLPGRFPNQPLIEAKIRATIAGVYMDFEEFDKADLQLQKSLELSRQALGEESRPYLLTLTQLAVLRGDQGRSYEGEQLYLKALTAQRKLFSDHDPDTLITMLDLGDYYLQILEFDKAQRLLEPALAAYRAIDEEDAYTLLCMLRVAKLYHLQQKYDKAEPLYNEAIAKLTRTQGEHNRLTLLGMSGLASLYREREEFARALPLYQKVLDDRRMILGERHNDTLAAMYELAAAYTGLGKTAEAEQLRLQMRELSRKATAALQTMPTDPLAVDSFQYVLGEDSTPQPMVIDKFGNIYVGGNCRDASGATHGVIREQLAGSRVWTTILDHTSDGYAGFHALAVNNAGDLYAGGEAMASGKIGWVVLARPAGGKFSVIDKGPGERGGYCACITVDADGTVYTAGVVSTSREEGSRSVWMVCKQDKGHGVFTTVDSWIDGTMVSPWAISAVTSGPGMGIYVVGESTDQTVPPVRGSWIVRRSIDGGETWRTVDRFQLDVPARAGARAITSDRQGNIYVVGYAGTYIGTTPQQPVAEAHWVVRKSSDGVTWAMVDDYRTVPGDDLSPVACGVTIDPGGAVWVAGQAIDAKRVAHAVTRSNVYGSWATVDDYQLAAGFHSWARAVVFDPRGRPYVAIRAVDFNNTAHWLVHQLPVPGAAPGGAAPTTNSANPTSRASNN